MKRIVTVLAFALICSGAYAQFNQGRWLAGGSVGLSTNTNKFETTNSTTTNSNSVNFSISPDVGYFVIDNLAVGAALDLSASSTKNKGTGGGKSSSSSVTLAPFVRYYYQNYFAQLQVGFGSGSSKYTPDNSTTAIKTKDGLFGWGLAAGYAYFLNDYVAIEPMVGYASNSSKDKDTDNKNINGGLFIKAGFQIYLGPRK
ncbi:MAG: outer membrane beta-barrel protein [Bacteroidota bacterium]